jgi:hypothetical protein
MDRKGASVAGAPFRPGDGPKSAVVGCIFDCRSRTLPFKLEEWREELDD